MASPSPHDRSRKDDDEDDPVEQMISRTGCAELHYAVQECMAEHQDWRACQSQVQTFKDCMMNFQNARKEQLRKQQLTSTQSVPSWTQNNTHAHTLLYMIRLYIIWLIIRKIKICSQINRNSVLEFQFRNSVFITWFVHQRALWCHLLQQGSAPLQSKEPFCFPSST